MREAITIEGVIFLETDGSWTAQSFLTFEDGESLSKTVRGLTSKVAAETVRESLIAEAEAAVLRAGGTYLDNNHLN